MSENENRPPSPMPPDLPPESAPPAQDSHTQNESPDEQPTAAEKGTGGGWAGIFLGCGGGILYLFLIIAGVTYFAINLYMRQILFDILVFLGPLPVLYYARKHNKRPLFWGFLIPYLLVLLLFGQCFTSSFRLG